MKKIKEAVQVLVAEWCCGCTKLPNSPLELCNLKKLRKECAVANLLQILKEKGLLK